MGKMGITLGNDKVAFDEKGNLSVNGQSQPDGSYLDGAVKKEGDQLKIEYGEYKLTIDAKHANGMDIAYASENVFTDGVMPHGLWGQTADGDGKARNGDKGSGAQGGGAIEDLDGTITKSGDKSAVDHYTVADLFDTGFSNFNRFSG